MYLHEVACVLKQPKTGAEKESHDLNVNTEHDFSYIYLLRYLDCYDISIVIDCKSVVKQERNFTVCLLCKTWERPLT